MTELHRKEMINLYRNDVHFHHLVKTLEDALWRGPITISELRAAVDLAEEEFEIQRMRDPYWRPMTREGLKRQVEEAETTLAHLSVQRVMSEPDKA